MNAWRWMGVFVLAAGLSVFGLTAVGQNTTKTTTKKATATTTKKAAAATTAATTKKSTAATTKKTEVPPGPEGNLAPKAFAGEKPFYQTLKTTTTQNMNVAGMKHEQTQNQTFYFMWTPKEKKSGQYTVVQKILGVKMDIDIAGNKISYDSTAGEKQAKNPMSEFFKQLVGQEFTLTISNKGKDGRYVVDKVEGVDALVKKLGKVNQSMVPLLNQILNEDTVKQMAEPMLGVIPPGGAIPKDKSWKTDSKLNMGPIGSYDTTNTYTADEKAKKDNELPIKVKTVLVYTKPMANQKQTLPFKIKDASLKSVDPPNDAVNTIWYNTEKGRVDKADLTVKLEGTITIDISNMETVVNLDQTQHSVLTTTDQPPAELKSSKKG
jgi:hypothetical protein